MSGMYGNGIGLTEKVLDYLWGRQNITLNNIANVDTPGFKAQYVTFEEELAKKIQNDRRRRWEEDPEHNSGSHQVKQSRTAHNLE